MNIKEILEPVKPHMKDFSSYYDDFLSSGAPYVDKLLSSLKQAKGKQVRPALVFLAAGLCGNINDRAYFSAALVETIHNASLIHDDIVDGSSIRRGRETINSRYGDGSALLFGDYLISSALLKAGSEAEYKLLNIGLRAFRNMSAGELMQKEKSMNLDITEEAYLKIATRKTAELIASACEMGAVSAGDNYYEAALLRKYGNFIGIAFQVIDDIFDYQKDMSAIGKPVNNDIREKKITLPLIYSYSKAGKKPGNEINRMMANGTLTDTDVDTIIDFVGEFGGINYAKQKAREYVNKAKEILSIFHDKPEKDSLMKIADFVLERQF